MHRKYRRLFSSSQCRKTPGPKGPSDALIQAIVELKSRNPRFGCPRIARIIAHTFGVDVDKNVVCRVLAKHYRAPSGGTGPSWLSFIGHTRDSADLAKEHVEFADAVERLDHARLIGTQLTRAGPVNGFRHALMRSHADPLVDPLT